MNYCIILKDGERSILLDSFDSKDKADRFIRSMRFWFSQPFQLVQVTQDSRMTEIFG